MMIFLIIYYCQLQFWRVSDLAVTFSHRQIRLLKAFVLPLRVHFLIEREL